jgi:methyltransferase (TIGR00027 family)
LPTLTASIVASIRALYTELPAPYDLAPDPVAKVVVPGLLALPALAVARTSVAGPWVARALGAVSLGLSEHVALRTRAIDDALLDGVRLGATQLVILGAGLDCRAERLEALASVRVFEVDHDGTHRYKAKRLARRGVPDKARSVTRVAVDFERDRLDEALLRAGLDREARSVWIWEGVTVYLSPEATLTTLRAVAALSAPGSRIAVTYTRPARRRLALFDPATRAIARAVGEPVRGMMETEAMVEKLAHVGFVLVSDESVQDWAARWWPGERIRDEWERLAVAESAERTPRLPICPERG